ncbi:MAG: hypothetical protein IT276_05795 [Ignavibacteriaceae bacterium]|nr:hypothetical protein [Ignavibacteriaceae bacterium]
MRIKNLFKYFFILSFLFLISCNNSEEREMENQTNIIFLHHSTGHNIWEGGISNFSKKLGFDPDVVNWFDKYNKKNGKNYKIIETDFPKKSPYGWNNYPYDYYNIWVKNAGDQPYQEEPTLEILTKKYEVIIFKHCFPVSNIKADSINPDINSDIKTLGNYKLQYDSLKKKLLEFPDTKFIVWTPTALVQNETNKDEAERANEFSEWVKSVWDTKGDNIFLWDFRELQVEGGLYFKNSYAVSENNSHPSKDFSETVAPFFSKRIVDVIEGNGDSKSLTGK